MPEGTLTEGEPSAQPGRQVQDRTGYLIKDAALETVSATGDQFVILKDRKFPLKNLSARTVDEGVMVNLKRGKFISRDTFSASSGESPLQPIDPALSQNTVSLERSYASSTERPSALIGRSAMATTKTIVLVQFSFEVLESRRFASIILPSPGDVARSFSGLWFERALARNIGISFLRILAGFFIAFLIVFPLSILMGTFSKIRFMFAPLMVFGGYMPIPAIVPLSLMFCGTGEFQKVMFLALGFSIYLLPLFVRAIDDVDNVYLQTAYTLGAGRWQVMTRVLLGIAWPNIYDAMRMGFGVGWGYIILAEIVEQNSGGIGAAIDISRRRGLTPDVYLILGAIVVIAFITDKIWGKLGDILFPYRSLKR